MAQDQASWRSRRSLVVAAAVGAALVWTTFSGDLLRPRLPSFDVPYMRTVLVNLADLAVAALLIGLAARAGPRRLFGLTGLGAPVARPLVWAAVLFVPAAAIAAVVAPLSRDFTGPDLFWKGGGFPVIEEIVYRGLAVGALIRWAGWRWWAACLAPAVAFGLAHAGQGEDLASVAGIVAITGLGGLLFGWLFVRWGFNLWPPILLHIGMNSLWIVFALGEDALGGWLGNSLRIAIVAGAVMLSLKWGGDGLTAGNRAARSRI
ncbi:CPBP family intramembrane glutamic endopeptidase [Phenylobacterium sp.]|jgi:membrane protease YdiL (CAAX protease family)|uniref:CPBP family intramembrane glutamic endopeptidase n=1 Tax=Phenylobacterium sp. TaxID=1871053 RepID=UPI002F959CC6